MQKNNSIDGDSSESNQSIPAVHISYKSYQTDLIINEDSLRTLFSTFGDVIDVTIKHATVDKVILLIYLYSFIL